MAQTFDPQLVSLVLVCRGAGQVVDFQQFADGSFIQLEYDSNAFDDQAGGNGHVVRVRNPDRRATLQVQLMAEAPENDQLSIIAQVDRLSGTGVCEVMLKYLDGSTIATAPEAWITKMSPISYGSGLEGRQWNFKLAEADIFVGSVDTNFNLLP